MVARCRLSIVASDWSTILNVNAHAHNGRSGGNLVGNGNNGLPYLVTHAINPRRGCEMLDAFQSNVVGRKYSSRRWCAVERWPSLHVVYWVLFSAVDKIPLVKCWFCARIWRNMSRAASLKLRRGPCDCFIELCAAVGAMLALIVAIVTPFSSRCNILDCQIATRHFTEAEDLKYPARRTKRCFGDLAERTKIVMAWPGDHRPNVSRGITTSRALGRENAISLLSRFY